VTITRECVRSIAQYSWTGTVPPLSDEVASGIAGDAEYRLRRVIEEALKFAAHSKHTGRLEPSDVTAALRLQGIAPLFGHSAPAPVPRWQRAAQTGPARALFFTQDSTVTLADVAAAPLPAARPQEIVLIAHWLAVEGVQPAVPQNPPRAQQAAFAAAAAAAASKGVVDAAEQQQLAAVQQQQPEEVRHVLSKEMQAFFEVVTRTLSNSTGPGSQGEVDAVLKAVEHDPGTAQLLPYLVRYIFEGVRANTRNLPLLWNLMALARTLVDSPSLCIDPYLQQLMPAVLTCVVSKVLCRDPIAEDHWKLRAFAAETVAHVCRRYSRAPSTTQRATRTLLHAFLDASMPLTTHYGAAVGLAALGPQAAKLLVPHLGPYVAMVERASAPEGNSPLRQREAKYVHQALLKAAGVYLSDATRLPASTAPQARAAAEQAIWQNAELVENYRMLYAAFGETITPFLVAKPPPSVLAANK